VTTDAPFSTAEVEAWRARFPILSTRTYLINNSLGAMPAAVPEALAAYSRTWVEQGVEAWTSDWLPLVGDVATLLERLLGAPAGSVVVHQNVSSLTGMVLAALDFPLDRADVLMAGDEWPSHRYLAAQHERAGARLRTVPAEALPDAVDERTRLVVVSHVQYSTSAIRDVTAIAARCRQVGALCLVDGYHAVGHMPVDVDAIGCDLYVGGSVKWLCGGPGVGYLFIRPDLTRQLRPQQVGWLGHAEPFAFSDAWEPAAGAAGWLGGTPSIPALYAAREGYRAILEASPGRIRASSERLTARLVDGVVELGLTVRSPLEPAQRGGAVTIDLGEGSARVGRELIAAGIIVDVRPGAGVRVGPHFFNTSEECDRLVDALAALC
jgi:kynureninase